MIKKVAFILVALAILVGTGSVLYQELFVGSEELKDAKISYLEGELRDKEKVVAECSISEENRFCYKDDAWAEMENKIEFSGFVVVEYTNDSDIVTEVSTGTARLTNVTSGKLTIISTDPLDIFVAPGEAVAVRYDVLFDTKDDESQSQVKSKGVDFKVTLTNEIGKSLAEFFTVEYKN